MGAEYWEHTTPFQPNAEAALRSLQAEVFHRAGYDLARLLVERIADMEQAIRWCEEDAPPNLSWNYHNSLGRFQVLAAEGVPDDPAARIALLQEIEANSSSQAPGILALTGVSAEWEEWKAYSLPPREVAAFFGTATPSADEVGRGIDRLADSIDRAMAACFPVFRDGRPSSWYFVGYTAD